MTQQELAKLVLKMKAAQGREGTPENVALMQKFNHAFDALKGKGLQSEEIIQKLSRADEWAPLFPTEGAR
jgi:hypothetical protein